MILALQHAESRRNESDATNFCYYSKRAINHSDLARCFRGDHSATPGQPALPPLSSVLYLYLAAVVMGRTQDACRESTRVLPRVLWPAFAHCAAPTLGRPAHTELHPAAMGDGLSAQCSSTAGDVWDLSLYEWSDVHNPGLWRCCTFDRNGTTRVGVRSRNRLCVSCAYYRRFRGERPT